MTFNTIQWLPDHLAAMKEWQQICKAYDYLLAKTFAELDEIYANQFLDSLTEIGCLIWERILGITIEQDETIENRRQTIRSYLVGDLPYTENKLRETLKNIAGQESVTVNVTQSAYEIRIGLTISAPATLANVQDIVYKMRPCNMIVRICISYKTTNDLIVGHAVKHIKTLKPTSPQGADPIKDAIWFADTDGMLLTDQDGSALTE